MVLDRNMIIDLYVTETFYCVCYRYFLDIMATVIINGHGDPSSNPGRDSLHFP